VIMLVVVICPGDSAGGMNLQTDTDDGDSEADGVHSRPLLHSTNEIIIVGQSLWTLVTYIVSMVPGWDSGRHIP